MTILERIVSQKLVEVAESKQAVSEAELEKLLRHAPALHDFKAGLRADGIQIIAEIKKASPSKGLLCPNFDPERLARSYQSSGAAALSVLTDAPFFQGSLDYLRRVREQATLPLLRKDFIIDCYQLLEARLYGADAVLLIASLLQGPELKRMLASAKELGMHSLVEVHNSMELDSALDAGAEIIGINNRDLATFEVKLETTLDLCRSIPRAKLIVSESGISRREHLIQLEQAGVHAVLIGESLVTAADPGAKIRELLGIGP